MRPDIYRVGSVGSGYLAIMAKPVAGDFIEEEFSGIAKEGMLQVVSLLERDEEYAVGLRREAELCDANGMVFRSYPIPDRGLPSSVQSFAKFIDSLFDQISEGRHTVVHCRGGIGRAGIVVASILMRSGMDPDSAFELVGEKRGVAVPDTEQQKQWVVSNSVAIAKST